MAIIKIDGLSYNSAIHGYILDRDYYTKISATNLEDILTADNATSIDAVVNSYLRRASKVFYEYVLSFNPKYRRYIQYQLCHDRDMVELVRDCLVEMVNYWALNGLDTTMLNPILNVDVERSVPVISQNDLKASAIPLSVKDMVANARLNVRWHTIQYDTIILEEYSEEEALYQEA